MKYPIDKATRKDLGMEDPSDSHNVYDTFYSMENVASTNECTGLTPSAVQTNDEAIAYGELYAIHPPLPPHDGI